MSKTGMIDWNDDIDAGKKSSRPKVEYLTLKPNAGGKNKMYTVRPLGKPFAVNRLWHNNKCTIIEDPDNNPIRDKHPEVQLATRYAFYCIDREDDKIKVVEMPITLYKTLKEWSVQKRKNPSHPEKGADFDINVEGNGKTKRKYSIMLSEYTSLSDDEISLYEEELERAPLVDVYKPLDDKIGEKILFDIKDDDEDDSDSDSSSNDSKSNSNNDDENVWGDDEETPF